MDSHATPQRRNEDWFWALTLIRRTVVCQNSCIAGGIWLAGAVHPRPIYDLHGNPVGWLSERPFALWYSVYHSDRSLIARARDGYVRDTNGKVLGFYSEGWFRDWNGDAVAFIQEAVGGPPRPAIRQSPAFGVIPDMPGMPPFSFENPEPPPFTDQWGMRWDAFLAGAGDFGG